MNKDKNNFKVMSIRIAMSQYREIEKYVDQHVGGMLNNSDFARRAFAEYIEVLRVASVRGRRADMSSKDKVQRRVDEKKADQDMKEEVAAIEQENLCMELEGNVREENGVQYCEWKTYTQMGPIISEGELEVPFMMLTRQHVRDQYQPTRQDVEAMMDKP